MGLMGHTTQVTRVKVTGGRLFSVTPWLDLCPLCFLWFKYMHTSIDLVSLGGGRTHGTHGALTARRRVWHCTLAGVALTVH